MEVLTCRTCAVGLTEPGGCDFCRDFKTRQIAVRGELAADAPVDLLEVSDEAIRMMQHQLKLLRLEQRKAKSYDPKLTREMSALGSTAAKLLDASRKLYEAGEDVLQSMSFQERMALFQEWFLQLPVEMQRKVFRQLSVNMARLEPAKDVQ